MVQLPHYIGAIPESGPITASLLILGSLPWTSFPEIHLYDSDAVMNRKLTNFLFHPVLWVVYLNCYPEHHLGCQQLEQRPCQGLCLHICTDIYMKILYYIFQHLHVHCTFLTGKDCMVLCVCCQGALHFHNISAIISSSILRIAITLHCYFCEIFRKRLCTFATLHTWRIWISYTTGSMHHELCENLIQLWEYVFVWNFCTNHRIILSYCLGLVCIITYP